MSAESTGGLASHLPATKARAFLGLIRAGEKLDRELNEALLSRHRIGLRAFEVLLFLAEVGEEGMLRMSELTRYAPLSQSRISRLVADLEAQGLVERTRARDDGRGVAVTITAAGRKVYREAQESHKKDLDRLIFDRLGETELRQLARITAKLLDD